MTTVCVVNSSNDSFFVKQKDYFYDRWPKSDFKHFSTPGMYFMGDILSMIGDF